ncbi:src like adaptor 1a [Clupea harengus]|uniref:Src like adaptor 1a n=1 Tax=Clupea harengus TaxID=7950 RepID=A0A6P8GSL5_CLUHA|nr:src like adaptor 1a [Clupea harengus]
MGNAKSRTGDFQENVLADVDAQLKESDDDVLVVLVDYPSPDISEPIFRMGERLKGLAEEGPWWKVRSLKTGNDNYIPNLCIAKIYHGWLFEGVVRQKAEELLRLPGNVVGSFMVRESPKQRGMYSLSVRHRAIKHYKIFRMDNSWYYISPRLTFQCLEDMVNHYSDAADGLCCVLTVPCQAYSSSTPSSITQPPPVVMRRNFEWKNVDKSQLINPNCPDNQQTRNMVSFGVRNSIASYLSLAETAGSNSTSNRKKKSKSVYVMSDTCNTLNEEDYE